MQTVKSVARICSGVSFERRAMLRFYDRALSLAAAALILWTCATDKPRELVAQSWSGFALQNGQTSVTGLVGSTSGSVGFALVLKTVPLFFQHLVEFFNKGQQLLGVLFGSY